MLFDDLVNIFFVHIRVPDLFGIDNDNRAFVAAIETTCIVDPYPPALAIEPEGLDSLLGVVTHELGAMIVTARGSRFTLVYTEEYMPQVVAHNMFSGIRDDESKLLYRNNDYFFHC
jgi:hypothetical protein